MNKRCIITYGLLMHLFTFWLGWKALYTAALISEISSDYTILAYLMFIIPVGVLIFTWRSIIHDWKANQTTQVAKADEPQG